METSPTPKEDTSKDDNSERYERRPSRGRGRGRVIRPVFNRRRHDEKEDKKDDGLSHHSSDKFSPENLDKLIGDKYPITSVAVSVVNDVLLDTHGYSILCSQTYSQMMFEDNTVQSKLSYPEFMLVMGWFLVRRVHQIRKDYHGEESYCDVLFKAIPDDTLVPGPIHMALESLGIAKTVGGTTLIPELALPSAAFKERYQQGVSPTLSRSHYTGIEVQASAHMYPFGMYMRMVFMSLGDPLKWGAHWRDRFNPGAASNTGDDVIFGNYMKLPGFCEAYEGANERKHGYGITEFVLSGDILGSVCYNGTLFRSYLSFVEYMKKYIAFSPFTKVITSSCSIIGFVDCDEKSLVCNRWRVYSSYTLNKWEMHASRLFKWRRTIDGDHDPTNGLYASWLRPVELTILSERNNEISKIVSDRDLITYYVSSFMLSKAKIVLM